MRPPSLLRNVLLVSLLTWLPANANVDWWVYCLKSKCGSGACGTTPSGDCSGHDDPYSSGVSSPSADPAHAAAEALLNSGQCEVVLLVTYDHTTGITTSTLSSANLKVKGVKDSSIKWDTSGGQKRPRQIPAKRTTMTVEDLPGGGFRVNHYWNDTLPAADASGFRTIPADAQPVSRTTWRAPLAGTPGCMDVVRETIHPQTGQWIAKTTRHTAPVGSSEWKLESFNGDTSNNPTLQPHQVEEMTRTVGSGFETLHRVTKTSPVAGQQASIITSDITTKHAFYKDGEPVELERITRHGNSQPDTITSWTYYTNPNDPVSFNKPATMRSSTGAWANYSYQGSEVTGSVLTKTITPWLDSPAPAVGTAPDESTCRVVTELKALKETGTFFREEKVLGQVVASLSGERFKEGGMLVERTKQKTGSGPELVTIRRGYPNDASVAPENRGRLHSVAVPDGTFELHTHKLVGTNRVETIETGAGTLSGITSGTRVERTYTNREELIGEKSTDIASGALLSTRTAIAYDLHGAVTRWAYDNDPSDYSETLRGCCGIESERARDGTLTQYIRDGLKRPVLVTSTTGPRVTTKSYAYSVDGGLPVTTVTTTASGVTGSIVENTKEDLSGRTISTTRPGPMGTPESTGYAYSADGRVTTQTNPDGGTIITESHVDGQTKSVTGTATIAKTYSYGVHNENGGGLVTTEITAGGVGGQTSSYSDLAGRTYKTEKTAPRGQTAVTLTTYNAKGQAEIITSSGQPAVNYFYNDEGERIATWTDRNGDGAFNDTAIAGVKDSCTTSQSDYLASANAPAGLGDCQRTITTVRTEANEDKVISTTWQSVDGLRARQETLGVAGASTTVQTRPILGAASGTQTNPDGTSTVTTTEILANGNTRGVAIRKDANGNAIETSETIADAAGRTIQTTNGRGHGTQYAYHSAGGTLASVSQVNAAPGGGNLVTSYAHTVTPGTGTLVTTTLPDGTHQYQETNLLGQTTRQWGSQINPVSFTYDAAGRQATLTTYRAPVGANADTFPTITGDTTTWTYDPSGVLLTKTYADGKGPQYTYDIAGRMLTRTWARGVIITYAYVAGQLTSTTYSNDPANTPSVAVTYDRLGRQVSQSNAYATTGYSYDPATLVLATETITIDADGSAGALPSLTRTLDRSRDALQRPTGYELKTSNLTLESSLGYGYDVSGRLATISASGLPNLPGKSHAFEYSYEPGSSLIDNVAGPVHEVDNDYEVNRNVLLQKKNTRTVGTGGELSVIGYGVNAIGQRVLRNLFGEIRTEFYGGQSTDPYATNWGYDPLGQVTSENKPSTESDRDYSYDQIGNRLTFSAAGASTNYATNALNQYSIISPPSPASPVNPAFDDDGNMTSGLLNGSSTGQFEYDAANQLVRTQSTATSDPTRCAYDAFGRRVAKVTYPNGGGAATEAAVFIYDGWNLIAEYALYNSSFNLHTSFTWGLDLSGSIQGAGGVGGLLAVTKTYEPGTMNRYYPIYDGNGNIEAYLDSNGIPASIYQYDAFGNVLSRGGKGAAIEQAKFSHRFSTKFQDGETGLLYYGYRYFDLLAGRWVNRDPIEEYGWVNLGGFLMNDPVNLTDVLGLRLKTSTKYDSMKNIYDTYGVLAHTGGTDGGMALMPESTGAIIFENREMNGKCCSKVSEVGYLDVDVVTILPSDYGSPVLIDDEYEAMTRQGYNSAVRHEYRRRKVYQIADKVFLNPVEGRGEVAKKCGWVCRDSVAKAQEALNKYVYAVQFEAAGYYRSWVEKEQIAIDKERADWRWLDWTFNDGGISVTRSVHVFFGFTEIHQTETPTVNWQTKCE